jgi:hypothetical protein
MTRMDYIHIDYAIWIHNHTIKHPTARTKPSMLLVSASLLSTHGTPLAIGIVGGVVELLSVKFNLKGPGPPAEIINCVLAYSFGAV